MCLPTEHCQFKWIVSCFLSRLAYLSYCLESVSFLYDNLVLQDSLELIEASCCNFLYVFLAVFLLCLTKAWTMMERKKALTIPFTVDNDTLVCMAHVLEIPSLHDMLFNVCASSEQSAWLLLILARYCSDAYIIAAIIKSAHNLLIGNST